MVQSGISLQARACVFPAALTQLTYIYPYSKTPRASPTQLTCVYPYTEMQHAALTLLTYVYPYTDISEQAAGSRWQLCAAHYGKATSRQLIWFLRAAKLARFIFGTYPWIPYRFVYIRICEEVTRPCTSKEDSQSFDSYLLVGGLYPSPSYSKLAHARGPHTPETCAGGGGGWESQREDVGPWRLA